MATITKWTWAIKEMNSIPSGNAQGFVTDVFFTLTGTDGTNTASVNGSVPFGTNAPSSFEPYSQLTEKIVLGWVQSVIVGDLLTFYQQMVQSEINSIGTVAINPVSQPLPWVAS